VAISGWRLGHPYLNEVANSPPKGLSFYHSETTEVDDVERGVLGLHYHRPGDVVLSFKFPVINQVPWVLFLDDLVCPWQMSGHELRAVCEGRSPYDIEREPSEPARRRLETMVQMLRSPRCLAIFPWSEWALGRLEQLVRDPIILDKTRLLYPALPLPRRWRTAHDDFNVLYVGRSFRRKGGREALEIFERFSRQHPRSRMFFVGECPAEVQSRFAGRDDIRFLGSLARESMDEVFRLSDVLLLPTKLDSWGIVYLEAMSFGLAIVTTTGARVPVTREIIKDDENGFLVETRKADMPELDAEGAINYEGTIDLDAFVARLLRLAGDRELLFEISMNNRRAVGGRFSVASRNRVLGQALLRS
jgi:glycosyltransferase involved in cell wall biosynthesis